MHGAVAVLLVVITALSSAQTCTPGMALVNSTCQGGLNNEILHLFFQSVFDEDEKFTILTLPPRRHQRLHK